MSSLKGKTYIEIYGKERALEKHKIKAYSKEKIKKEFLPIWNKYGPFTKWQLKDLSKKYNICGYDTIKKYYHNLDNFAKEVGITFVIPDRAKNIRISKERIINDIQTLFKIHNSLTKTELYKKLPYHPDVVRRQNVDKIVKKLGFVFDKPDKGKGKRISKKKIIRELKPLLKQYPNLSKTELTKLINDKLLFSHNVVASKIKWKNFKKLFNYNIQPGQLGFAPGKNENKILDIIEKEKNIKLKRQYPIDGYFIDGFDKKNNVAYEIDEPYHKLRKIKFKDKLRQERIEQLLECKFIRIDEQEFLKNNEVKAFP